MQRCSRSRCSVAAATAAARTTDAVLTRNLTSLLETEALSSKAVHMLATAHMVRHLYARHKALEAVTSDLHKVCPAAHAHVF